MKVFSPYCCLALLGLFLCGPAAAATIVEYTFSDGNASTATNTGTQAGMNGTIAGGSIAGSPFSADNKALLLAGNATDGIAMPNNYNFGAALTVEALVRLDAFNASNTSIIFDDYGGPGVLLQVNTAGQLLASVSPASGTVNLASNAAAIALGQWYHVATTYNGSNVALFINGANVASGAGTGNVQNHAAVLPHIGNESGGTDFPWNGAIDDFRIHDVALDVASFNGGNALPTSADPVPEPSTLLLLGSGLIAMVGWRRHLKTA